MVLRLILSLTVVWLCRGYGRAMVRTMTAACAVPHFHLHDDIAMTKLMQLRRDLQIHVKDQKLTMLPFIIKVQNTSPLAFTRSNACEHRLRKSQTCSNHLERAAAKGQSLQCCMQSPGYGPCSLLQ